MAEDQFDQNLLSFTTEKYSDDTKRETEMSTLKDLSLDVSDREIENLVKFTDDWQLEEETIPDKKNLETADNVSDDAHDGYGEDDEKSEPNGESEQDFGEINGRDGIDETEVHLHCAFCHQFLCKPKILNCLHSFCEKCLEQRVKPNHKYVFCPVRRCRVKTFLGLDRIKGLPDNTVIEKSISLSRPKQEVINCVICQLHDQKTPSTGTCLDCGDMMCRDCCEKHTFSRQTAKHRVLSFEEMKPSDWTVAQRQNSKVPCEKHPSDFIDYFCQQCNVVVCKTCVSEGHQSHHIEGLKESVCKMKCDIQSQVDLLKDKCESKLVDDTKEAEMLVAEHEKIQFEQLRKAKEELIEVIEQKYRVCLEKLQREFNIKRRKYCTHRKTMMDSIQYSVCTTDTAVGLVLKEGEEIEIAKLEPLISNRIADIEGRMEKVEKVHPKLSKDATFPSLHTYTEHVNVLKGLTFFDTKYSLKNEKNKERKMMNMMHVENGEVRMAVGANRSNAVSVETSICNMQPQPLLSSDLSSKSYGWKQRGVAESQGKGSMGIKGPIGRGSPLRRNVDPSSGPSRNRTSLLGEYCGQNAGQNLNLTEDNFRTSALQQSDIQFGQQQPFTRTVKTCGSFMLQLKLRASIDVKVLQDQGKPDITDVVFVSVQNFVVSDARNMRLKMFSTCGKFLSFVNDPGPSAVTFCGNHLVWNSQYTTLKLYDMSQEKIVRVQRVPSTAPHPLTTFNNTKFLVGNMPNSSVDAFTVNGELSHTIQPSNRDGSTVGQVSSIAARSLDQFICVDSVNQRVVVNNFDGQFMGEYCNRDFEPGAACITEHGDIFVTDKRNNKLILLTSRGEFVRDWSMLVDKPSCVASNGKGNLIVAGQGKSVSVYEYSY